MDMADKWIQRGYNFSVLFYKRIFTSEGKRHETEDFNCGGRSASF